MGLRVRGIHLGEARTLGEQEYHVMRLMRLSKHQTYYEDLL